MPDMTLVKAIADADGDSRFYGSAAQAKAQEILALVVRKSWSNDDAEVYGLVERIAFEYDAMLALLNLPLSALLEIKREAFEKGE